MYDLIDGNDLVETRFRVSVVRAATAPFALHCDSFQPQLHRFVTISETKHGNAVVRRRLKGHDGQAALRLRTKKL